MKTSTEINNFYFMIGMVIIFILLFLIAFKAEKEVKAYQKEAQKWKQTAEMYNLRDYKKLTNGNKKILALSYCDLDILLIDIKDREYWQALESFNHEWQHCNWGDHFNETN